MVYHHDGANLVPLTAGVPVILGRGAGADLCFRGARVSRHHARFELGSSGLLVHDLGSTNGTVVNGTQIRGTVILKVHDEVEMGSVVATVTALAPRADLQLGLDGNDAFMAHVQAEVVRASTFKRPMALVMVRDLNEVAEELHRWAGSIRAAARSVDRVGLYQPGQLGVMIAEGSQAEAVGFAEAIVAAMVPKKRHLGVGVAIYPRCGRTVEEMVSAACEAVGLSTKQNPIVLGGTPQGITELLAAPDRDGNDVVVRAPSMLQVYRRVDQVAPAPVPVLLLGETGTGKEILAQAIHERSKRKDKPLCAINCAAIPANLMESQLFGHEKGAFTGAGRMHKGVFETANSSTIFLDEVGELSLPAQAALLRVLDNQEIQRVGSTRPISVDVRIVAATNRNLEAMVDRGAFRLDLLHRINLITIEVPPLRERLSEIMPLCNQFIRAANLRYSRNVTGFRKDVMPMLLKYHWPGNVRELRNVVERAVLMALEDQITPDDLPAKLRQASMLDIPDSAVPILGAEPDDDEDISDPPTITPLDGPGQLPTLRDAGFAVETVLVRRALEAAGGNRAQAAEILGIPRRTLDHKISAQGLGEVPTVKHGSVLTHYSRPEDETLSMKERVALVEKRLLAQALQVSRGDLTLTARMLQVDRRTLKARMKRYKL
jgi:transcriptional regulator with PAS, ATPase and Fis domain/pSer/pThr/pTyr-binding forkhead associated (FHA) protein